MQAAARGRAVDESRRKRVCRVQVTGEQHLLGLAEADVGQQQRGLDHRGDAELDLRKAEPRVRGGDAHIARQRHLERPAEAVAVDHRDRRDRREADRADARADAPPRPFRSRRATATIRARMTTSTHIDSDVLIVGAGISGIGAGCYLKSRAPGRSFAILEGRDAIGGTWDLFRFPGIRSDSDLFTFGFGFKPWTSNRSIAQADLILDYLHETVREHDLERHIAFGHRVVAAHWSSEDARWTV